MKSKLLLLTILFSIYPNIDKAQSESFTLQDIICSTAPLPAATIYVAREIATLNPNKPSATAVAVVGDRILAVDTLDELKAAAGDQPYTIDKTFADKVIVPGFIAQHDHPLLRGLTGAASAEEKNRMLITGNGLGILKNARVREAAGVPKEIAEYIRGIQKQHST